MTRLYKTTRSSIIIISIAIIIIIDVQWLFLLVRYIKSLTKHIILSRLIPCSDCARSPLHYLVNSLLSCQLACMHRLCVPLSAYSCVLLFSLY